MGKKRWTLCCAVSAGGCSCWWWFLGGQTAGLVELYLFWLTCTVGLHACCVRQSSGMLYAWVWCIKLASHIWICIYCGLGMDPCMVQWLLTKVCDTVTYSRLGSKVGAKANVARHVHDHWFSNPPSSLVMTAVPSQVSAPCRPPILPICPEVDMQVGRAWPVGLIKMLWLSY